MQRARRKLFALAGCIMLALLCGACAGMNAPDANRPRANQPDYPLVIAASNERREVARAAWTSLTRAQGVEPAPMPELQTATATVRALPALATPLRLPQVGGDANASNETAEEHTREALRRFIRSARALIGTDDAARLSLIEVTEAGAGAKRALYQQRSFLYPIRNGYGELEIVFTPDRRVQALRSTIIPDTERLARAFTAATRNVSAREAIRLLAGRSFSYTDALGREQSRTIAASDELVARELVVYPLPRAGAGDALELHLAWEIAAGQDSLVYVDVVTGEIIAAAPAPPATN